VTALAMSTADSCINTSSVLFANDFCKPLNIGNNKELVLSRMFAFLLGSGGIILALVGKDLLDIVLTANSYYMPIVTVPLMVTILGFRSSTLSVLTGMIAGLLTVVIWNILGIEVDCIVFAMLMNLIFLVSSHYLLKQPGGWVKIKDDSYLKSIRAERKRNFEKLSNNISGFSFIEFCRKHAPVDELAYTGLGIYCFFYTITTMYATDSAFIRDSNTNILTIYQIMMVTSVIIAMYPIWPSKIKYEIVGQVAWNIVIFYMLILFSGYFALINKFGSLPLVVFTLNLVIAAILCSWKLATPMIVGGFYLSIQLYKYSLKIDELSLDFGSMQAVLIYTLLLTSTAIVIFLKPKQEQYELSTKRVGHLSGRLDSQEKELMEALGLRAAFIRNVSHEYHTPMTGVVSLAESLLKSYKSLSLDKIGSYIEIIYKSAIRLESYDNNINMLSKLSKGDYKLNLKSVNLSSLIYDRIEVCRKLYEQNSEDREFIINIAKGVVADIDKEYFIQLLDNLIINAITYCKQGKITIILKNDDNQIILTIDDEGIGIPTSELENIFGEFIVSSRTHTIAGGRGVGLALCKKVVDFHNGAISAYSDGIRGALFEVILFKKETDR
ncbi:MAG: ATP-binding protein, partial [Janthinobacterium lividum]